MSRRTFLRANGAVLAAGVLGAQLPATAHALGSTSTPMLPSFGRATHLDVAGVGALHGYDQLLLTTLQGVVNREQPRLYFDFAFEDSGADRTWLSSTGADVTEHDDPLALFDRYRHEIGGAILHDPGVPDSVNVATTLAGIEGAVAATAEQAEKYGLKIIEDLRGRFDAADPAATYRWQLEHLFPRCSDVLVAGLPPTRTVEIEGVKWREVAREKERIRDRSNREVRTLDLSAELGGDDGVFLRFQDSFEDDGWGASVGEVAVLADGTEIAAFTPGTDAEEPFLFSSDGSAVSSEIPSRFCDGGGYFVYRFEAPPGTKKLEFRADMFNQFLVTATTAKPTRVEPFPYFRDYAVAAQAMTVWLPPSGETGDVLDEVFAELAPGTPYTGWFSNDVAGEWGGVDRASQHGVPVVPADFYMNGTVHAGVGAEISDRVPKAPAADLRNRVYLTLTVGEGDNVQYCQRHMRELWDHTDRGKVPVNWTVSPLLADIGPALLAHYQRTATANDLLICGPSGAGYSYAGAWPADILDRYTELTGHYMRHTGIDLVYAYNPRTEEDDGWIPFDERVVASYRDHAPVRGIIQSWESGDLQIRPAGVPVIGNFSPTGSAAEYHESLLAHIGDWDGNSPMFIAGAINAWNWTPGDIAELAGLLGDPFELVRGDTFFTLLDEAG
ncbi:GxGYxYP domain-containing protein [Streptomyces triticagri]|uniref:GxGYxYP domain-containing protein n=1 Tax=Streptomyces triticagri TaxID=2293568 RepID=UPI001F1A414D|nr:GxGYxYP domain-containing protein [Streptomyces triticagri]